MSFNFVTELPNPEKIKREFPLNLQGFEKKKLHDEKIKNIFCNNSNKFILIIGPCSADNENAVLEYIHRLKTVQDKVSDKIVMIPRIYTNKPRTTGDGYKGMIHQPDPNKKPDMLRGLLAIRNLHVRAIEETGFSCADEMLYPENYSFIDDLLGYVAIGARSVENQQHRLVSSGIDVPVGMKNPTSGDFSVMLNSITAAQHPHHFIYRNNVVATSGNKLAHAILRGSVNKHGQAIPNYHYEDLVRLYEMYNEKQLENMALIIDVNHSNSNKHYLEQIRISKEILHSKRHSSEINSMVKGLMIESYLEDGCQSIGQGIYGKSITDPCLGWEKTEKLIYEIADIV